MALDVGNQARVHQAAGDRAAAQARFEAAAELHRELRHDGDFLTALAQIALLQRQQHQPREALRTLGEEEILCRRLARHEELAMCLANQAAVLGQELGETRRGLELAAEALAVAARAGLADLAGRIAELQAALGTASPGR